MIPENTIVVVSPHSDDGVLSLGASMAPWARSGRRVELLTVLALDPDSTAPTGGWDRRAGFVTEGAAARERREEDRVACARLGVTPGWLPFGSVDFDRHGDEDDVWAAVRPTLESAGCVLVPGSPLTHPDHAWLNELLTRYAPPDLVGLYAEQPYTARRVRYAVRDRRARRARPTREVARDPRLSLAASAPGHATRPRRGPLALALAEERVAWPGV